jgi:predicted ribosomally synthesized peptide with nif11-like leader
VSQKSATDYIAKLTADGELESAIEGSLKGGDFFSAASEQGFSFSADEWAAALATHSGNIAITDEELEGITGGSPGTGQTPTPNKAINNQPRPYGDGNTAVS